MTLPLGSFLRRPPRYGIGAAAVEYRPSLPTYIRITDIGDDGHFSPSPPVSVDSPLSQNYVLQNGDLVVARTGASVGKSYRYRPSDGPLVFAGFLIAITPDPTRLDPRYLGYALQTKWYWDWIAAESTRSGQPGVNAGQLALLPIAPPSLPEQTKVADRLELAEELVVALQRLIAKKQDMTHGMLQRLLTGETRLPGFAGEWRTTTAGEVGTFRGGNGFPVRFQGDQSAAFPFFKVSDMNNSGNETFMIRANNSIDEPTRALIGATVFPKDAIVFAKVGAAVFLERKRILVRPSCIDNNMAALVVNEQVADHRFMHRLLQSFPMSSLVATGALPSLNGTQLRSIPVAMPADLAEQREIAAVLDDADSEIAALERRLESARCIKRGMMQELLPGRTRLDAEEVVA